MHVPDLEVSHDKGMPRVGAGAVYALAQIDAVQPAAAMSFVVVKAHERKLANVDSARRTVGLLHVEHKRLATARRGLETEAVLIVIGGDIPRERIAAIGPPK